MTEKYIGFSKPFKVKKKKSIRLHHSYRLACHALPLLLRPLSARAHTQQCCSLHFTAL
jgi:hypothetical protein